MTKIRMFLLGLFFLIGLNNLLAQDVDNPWSISLGVNAVDFYPVNNSELIGLGYGGSWYEEFSNANDHYNMIASISRVSVSRYLQNSFSFELSGTLNRIENIGDLKVNDLSYFALDGGLKFSSKSILNTGEFDPYIIIGGGYTWFNSKGATTGNLGLGVNYWFNDYFGLNVQSAYKHSFAFDVLYSHFQHAAGVVFKFGGIDEDSDGVFGSKDLCPDIFGLKEFNGCPDTDGDGFPDSKDKCPEVAGEFEGCPDSDLDGVPDHLDPCPDKKGELLTMGCPDSDGDGFSDDKDACPDVPGNFENRGCPNKDTDGDGVADIDDKCVDIAGSKKNNGCPWPDADGDGVANKDDDCPDVAGSIDNNGCVGLPESVKVALRAYASTIDFDKDKATLKEQHPDVIKHVADIILDFPNRKFVVEGHTSHSGPTGFNQKLSEDRAEAVKVYLVKHGVDESLISTVGYGKSQPLYPGKSDEAKKANRRVVIKLAVD